MMEDYSDFQILKVRSGLQSVNSEVKTLKSSFKELSSKVGISWCFLQNLMFYISCFFGQDPSLMASVNAFSWSLHFIFNVFKVISGEQTAKATRDQISTVTIINEAMTDSQMWFNMI